jgi:hypothetical protein
MEMAKKIGWSVHWPFGWRGVSHRIARQKQEGLLHVIVTPLTGLAEKIFRPFPVFSKGFAHKAAVAVRILSKSAWRSSSERSRGTLR